VQIVVIRSFENENYESTIQIFAFRFRGKISAKRVFLFLYKLIGFAIKYTHQGRISGQGLVSRKREMFLYSEKSNLNYLFNPFLGPTRLAKTHLAEYDWPKTSIGRRHDWPNGTIGRKILSHPKTNLNNS
jgi:hypothetical protein